MWWAINAVGTPPNWFTAHGTRTDITNKYPGSEIQGPFTNKQAASRWCNQHNGKTPAKPHGKGTHGTKNTKPSGALIVALARSWLGVPYVFGGTTRQGVDCSGFVMNVAHEAGISSCPRTSEEQWAWCEKIGQSQAGAGDLVFFVGAPEEAGPPGHIGIIISPGTFIDAPFPGTVVRYDHYNPGPPNPDPSNANNLWGYGRMKGAAKSSTANPYIGEGGAAGAQQSAAAAGSAALQSVGTISVMMGLILLFAILLAVAFWWKGR